MSVPLPATVAAFVAASPIQRAPIARSVAAAARQLPKGTRVLDAGAGDAPYRELFGHCEYLTQDWPRSVHEGASHADVISDLHELPLRNATFDFVLCTEVLEHVADPERVTREIRRILRPGGHALVTVPFVGELHEEPHDYRRWTSRGIETLLRRAGFGDARAEPLTGYYGTLAHVLRHAGLATRPTSARQRTAGRAVAFSLLCASGMLQRIAPRLDVALDERHALPVGWVCRAGAP